MCPAQKPSVYRLSGDSARERTILRSSKKGRPGMYLPPAKPREAADCSALFGRSRALEIVRPRLRCHPSVDSSAQHGDKGSAGSRYLIRPSRISALLCPFALWEKSSGIALTSNKSFVLDGKGVEWLIFGSFWDSIKMRRGNGSGLLSASDTTIYSLARRAKPAEVAIAHRAPG